MFWEEREASRRAHHDPSPKLSPGSGRPLAAAQGKEEEESEDDEGLKYGPAPLYRRMGLPARVLVDREGDRYILSRHAANEAIEMVLYYRQRALERHRLQPTAILPFKVHSEALNRVKKWFENSNLGKRALECAEKFTVTGDTYGSQT